MAKIEKLPLPPFQNGMIREAALDENLVPNDTLELSLNLNSDRIGALQLRPGITMLGTRITSGIITAITLNAAGGSYVANDVLTIATGRVNAKITVNTVTTGAIATFTLTSGGSGYSTGTGVAVTGGTGTGATFNITTIATQDISVLGMTSFRNNAGSILLALAKIGTNVYAYDGAAYTSIRTGLNATSKARFTNFVNYTYMVNGHANENIAAYNGSGSFVDNANSDALPKGDFIENYRSRIWVADSSDDKVYYSAVAASNGTITGGTDFIQVSPQDGEKITGLKRYPRALLVFKQNHIYRIFSTDSADPDPSIFRGTHSQESIVEGKNGISYHHPSGFYDFVFDGDQKEISRPIVDIVRAIPRSAYENIIGWADDNNKYWSVGDITLGGVVFSNIVCRYSISTQTWTVYSYNKEMTASTQYDNGTTLSVILGNEQGKILTFNSGLTDDGSPIYYDLMTHWMYFSQIKSTAKTISEIGTIHENAQGGNLSYQVDTDSLSEWRPIGEIKKNLYQLDKLNAKDFTRIRFRMSGSSTGSPFIFRGWELLNMMTEGEIKQP